MRRMGKVLREISVMVENADHKREVMVEEISKRRWHGRIIALKHTNIRYLRYTVTAD